jgi:uncharacterized membrane protein YqiK
MKNRLVILGIAALLAVGLTAPAFGASNPVSSAASTALATAEKALAKAKKANKKAKAAAAAAANAQASADAAQASADTAQVTADNALTVANAKYGTVTFQAEPATASDETTKIGASTCPTGKRAVGGGYTLTGGANAAYVAINQPYGNNSWLVQALDSAVSANNWSLTVSVNCIGS